MWFYLLASEEFFLLSSLLLLLLPPLLLSTLTLLLLLTLSPEFSVSPFLLELKEKQEVLASNKLLLQERIGSSRNSHRQKMKMKELKPDCKRNKGKVTTMEINGTR